MISGSGQTCNVKILADESYFVSSKDYFEISLGIIINNAKNRTWYNDVFFIEGIVDHWKGEFDSHSNSFNEMFSLTGHQIDGLVIVEIDKTWKIQKS
jgi:hypothetical protein